VIFVILRGKNPADMDYQIPGGTSARLLNRYVLATNPRRTGEIALQPAASLDPAFPWPKIEFVRPPVLMRISSISTFSLLIVPFTLGWAADKSRCYAQKNQGQVFEQKVTKKTKSFVADGFFSPFPSFPFVKA
jgi:hypothetical protein